MSTNERIDLTPAHYKEVTGLLKQYLPDTTVWAYGSRVRFSARPDSDLDLVAFTTPGQSASVSLLREAFDESSLPFRVDFFVWDEVPEKFHATIEREYVALQKVDKLNANAWALTRIEDIQAQEKGAIAIGPFGSRMKSDCYVRSGIPVIRGMNITTSPAFEGDFVFITERKANELGSSNVYQHDLVFPHRGSIGEAGIVHEDKRYVLSSSLMKLTCDKTKVNPKFLYYFFKTHHGKHELLKNASQVGTPGIGQPLSSLKAIYFHKPPLETQNKVVKILTSLDNKIQLNNQINQTLENMAQTLFKSWFVDFDPVMDNVLDAGNPVPEPLQKRAEQRRVLREQENTPTLPEDIRRLFPNRFVFNETLDKWVPEGWEVKPVSSVVEINPQIKLSKGAITKFVDMKAMPTSGFCINRIIGKAYAGGMKFNQYDVLLARITPCLENGKTGLVDFLKENEVGFGSTEFIVFRQKRPVNYPFIACLARENSFRIHCIQSMVGSSGRQRVQNACFDSFYLALPVCSEPLNFFDRQLKPSFEKMYATQREILELTKLRDTLLPKLISGELRIPEAID